MLYMSSMCPSNFRAIGAICYHLRVNYSNWSILARLIGTDYYMLIENDSGKVSNYKVVEN